ncbi:hypothetical protein GCM10009733_032390 [Nonomuraea maheshkhaliensis]|uniref:Uncharacterized protein n=1 Tax=Nonomuraea maheshkhaliensis TaxID=419590 RepID=A0ABN2F6I4_9ACTN
MNVTPPASSAASSAGAWAPAMESPIHNTLTSDAACRSSCVCAGRPADPSGAPARALQPASGTASAAISARVRRTAGGRGDETARAAVPVVRGWPWAGLEVLLVECMVIKQSEEPWHRPACHRFIT